ncbi:MAG: spondin domain-containing protein [Planctomycetota bacterium]
MRALRICTLGGLAAVGLTVSGHSQNGAALYELTFESTWSATTHPIQFPPNPHFSPLIGGTHSDRVRFWEVGGLATTGIESMAETGSPSALRVEVTLAIARGTADQILQFSGLGTSPSSRTQTFTVDADSHYLTLVSMLAPSPDWFVGVTALDLRPNGEWLTESTVPLLVWDAGTDSGTTYRSPNAATVPPDPIAQVTTTSGPFAGRSGPVGTFTIRRIASSLVYGCGVNPDGSLTDVTGPAAIGQTSSVRLHDPTGGLGSPVGTFVAVAAAPLPSFPCGVSMTGLGLVAAATPGEVLIAPPFPIVPGPAWSGAPTQFDLSIPSELSLAGQKIYLQGVLASPTRAGLTNAVELLIGT